MTRRLVGKRIIITGAVDNIGKAAVEAFIAEGARVIIGDIDADRGEGIVAASGADSRFIHVDVSREDSVARLVEAGSALARRPRCAAPERRHPALRKRPGLRRLPVGPGIRGRCSSAILRRQVCSSCIACFRSGFDRHTSSLAGKRGAPGLAAYAASKGAVIAFTTTLALELAPDRIRVDAICPGWIDTAFNQPIIDFMGGRERRQVKVDSLVPLGRQGMPAELAPLFVFLAFDEFSYVTAQAILADGGAYN